MHVAEHLGIFIQWELILAVGIPLTGLAVAIGRHFWKKSQCFTKMMNRLDNLEKHDESSVTDHSGFDEEIESLKKEINTVQLKQSNNEIYLKLLLKKFDIPYD